MRVIRSFSILICEVQAILAVYLIIRLPQKGISINNSLSLPENVTFCAARKGVRTPFPCFNVIL
jgi:hypothetical protein